MPDSIPPSHEPALTTGKVLGHLLLIAEQLHSYQSAPDPAKLFELGRNCRRFALAAQRDNEHGPEIASLLSALFISLGGGHPPTEVEHIKLAEAGTSTAALIRSLIPTESTEALILADALDQAGAKPAAE